MSKRPRKAPEKRKPVRRPPGLASRAFDGVLHLIGRNPALVGGTAAFIVIFSFVSANALWYQHGEHPSPFFRTRNPDEPNAFSGQRNEPRMETGEVTTFKIERPDQTETNSIEDVIAASGDTVPAQPSVSTLVRDVQTELIGRGLYNGAADGVSGPRTAAAILAFEIRAGLPQNGEATPELLAALRTADSGGKVLPKERPAEDVASSASEIDPVAAAIRDAESRKQKPALAIADPELVMKIQKGLSNLAYADIRVDGVAGAQTRDAIRHFEKHYRLPQTVEPSQAVLKKMKEIGAL